MSPCSRALPPALAAGFAVVLLPAFAAVAQPPGDRTPAAMLERADTDGDGKLSREEFVKSRTAEIEAAFGRMDADGDGRLDERELAAAAERMRAAAGAPRGGERPGARPRREGSDGARPQRPAGGVLGEAAFARIDRDGDGKLSREEFEEGMERLRALMQRGGPGAGPGMREQGARGRAGRGPEEGFRRPPQEP